MFEIAFKMEKGICLIPLTIVIVTIVQGHCASIANELNGYNSITDDYINKINSLQNSWTAGHNFPLGTTFEDLKILSGMKPGRKPVVKAMDVPANVEIPKFFDARKKWPHCKSIREIKNQGHCGSCWAVSSATTMSDRLCISTKGKFNDDISAQHITSCSDCSGCHGGWPSSAWDHFIENGAPTGGDYNSNKGCQPYLVEPCINRTHNAFDDLGQKPKVCERSDYVHTPACQSTCYNHKFHKGFKQDLHHGKEVHGLPQDVQQIQLNIMQYGPVVAGIEVFADFYTYKSGVYQRLSSEFCGLHAIRVIGWGEENGKDYWLITNQWGKEWGDKGTVKFLRGKDECGVESDITAGTTGPV